MKYFIIFATMTNFLFLKNSTANTLIADWHCFDKNIGVVINIYNIQTGEIEFSFLNEDIAFKKFKTQCRLLKNNSTELTYHCNKDPEYGDFGFGIIKNWNHSVNMGFFYDNHGEFNNIRPLGTEQYNEFLTCNKR